MKNSAKCSGFHALKRCTLFLLLLCTSSCSTQINAAHATTLPCVDVIQMYDTALQGQRYRRRALVSVNNGVSCDPLGTPVRHTQEHGLTVVSWNHRYVYTTCKHTDSRAQTARMRTAIRVATKATRSQATMRLEVACEIASRTSDTMRAS